MEQPQRNNITVLEFLSYRAINGLEITPKFQRRTIWSRPARSFLIDTILREMPIPPIYLRMFQSKDRKRTVRQVVDGQQRIRSVLDFVEGKYELSNSLEAGYKGSGYDDLDESEQDRILNYGFNCEIFSGISDEQVLEIFERLNTHSISLNAQELRNGKFFGPFKQSAYSTARDHLTFWRNHRIFSENAIARMREVELISELMVMSLSGMQDKKASITDHYKKYDEQYELRTRIENRIRHVLDQINLAVPETLGQSEFRRSPLFYSLFAAIYHVRYSLKKYDAIKSPKTRLTSNMIERFGDAIRYLSNVIVDARKNQGIAPRKWQPFVTACLRQTDNIGPRSTRTETLLKQVM